MLISLTLCAHEKLGIYINPILVPAGVGAGEALLHKQIVVGPAQHLNRLFSMPTFLVKTLQDNARRITEPLTNPSQPRYTAPGVTKSGMPGLHRLKDPLL